MEMGEVNSNSVRGSVVVLVCKLRVGDLIVGEKGSFLLVRSLAWMLES